MRQLFLKGMKAKAQVNNGCSSLEICFILKLFQVLCASGERRGEIMQLNSHILHVAADILRKICYGNFLNVMLVNLSAPVIWIGTVKEMIRVSVVYKSCVVWLYIMM